MSFNWRRPLAGTDPVLPVWTPLLQAAVQEHVPVGILDREPGPARAPVAPHHGPVGEANQGQAAGSIAIDADGLSVWTGPSRRETLLIDEGPPGPVRLGHSKDDAALVSL